MSRKAQIQAKADHLAQVDAAWASFEEAIREKEPRRPTRQVDVTSDEEHARMSKAYKKSLFLFKKAMYLRDLRFKNEFSNFFTESFPFDDEDDKDAASEAARCISNSLSVYCQAYVDPYFALLKVDDSTEHLLPGLRNVEFIKLPPVCESREVILHQTVLQGALKDNGYLHLDGHYLTGFDRGEVATAVGEAIKNQKSLSQYLRTEIDEARKSPRRFRSDLTASLLRELLRDRKQTNALLTIATTISLQISKLISEAAITLVELHLLLQTTGAQLPETIEPEMDELDNAFQEFLDEESEVSGIEPWMSDEDHKQMEGWLESADDLRP